MNTKRFFYFFAALAMIVCGCEKEKQEEKVDYAISCNIDNGEYGATEAFADSFSFTVSAEGPWEIKLSVPTASRSGNVSDWLSVYPSSGEAGTHTITVRIQPNPTLEFRQGRISLGYGKEVKSYFDIEQYPQMYYDQDKIVLTVALFEPGTLENLLRGSFESLSQISALRILGQMNQADLDCAGGYRDIAESLLFLDLREASFPPEAFSRHYGVLRYLLLPDNMTFVPAGAFSNLKELEQVSGAGIEIVGESAFGNCPKLKKFNFPKLTEIKENAFVSCQIEGELVMEGVTELGRDCFAYNDYLTKVEFPKVETVGYGAFSKNRALAQALFPAADKVDTEAFAGCSQLKKVEIGNVRFIEGSAFSGCSSLEQVSEGNVLKKCISLGSGAFSGCAGLKSLDFPVLPELPFYSFDGSGLTELKFGRLDWTQFNDSFNNFPYSDPKNVTLYLNPAPFPRAEYPSQWWSGDGGNTWRFCGKWWKEIKGYGE